MKLKSLLLGALLLAGCLANPRSVTVVAPTGPASQAQTQAIDEHLAKLVKATDAATDALSKASASAGAIRTINTGQPAGPRTVGVDGEAGLIQAVAGDPKAVDQLAASERARIVAEGKADQITAAYQTAEKQAQEAGKALVDTKTALAASEARLTQAKVAAEAEQQALQARYQARIDQLQRDADARVAVAQAKAKADQRRQLTWIFFGGAAALTALGITVLFLAGSVPIFGPKAGIALLASGAGLAALGTVINVVQDFADKHPTAVWVSVMACVAGCAIAVGMFVSNHHHAMDTVKSQAGPLIDRAKNIEADVLAKARRLVANAEAVV